MLQRRIDIDNSLHILEFINCVDVESRHEIQEDEWKSRTLRKEKTE